MTDGTTSSSTSIDYRGRNFVVLSFDEFGPIEVRPQRGSNSAREKLLDRVSETYHRDKGVRHLLSAYDLTNDRMHAHMEDHKTNVQFHSMKYLRSLYPAFVLVYLMLDNFDSHTVKGAEVRALEQHPFLPHAYQRLPAQPDRAPLRAAEEVRHRELQSFEPQGNLKERGEVHRVEEQAPLGPMKGVEEECRFREVTSARKMWVRDFGAALEVHRRQRTTRKTKAYVFQTP